MFASGKCHSQLLWVTVAWTLPLLLSRYMCYSYFTAKWRVLMDVLLAECLWSNTEPVCVFFLCELTFSWISWWLIQPWRRGKWSTNMPPFSRGWGHSNLINYIFRYYSYIQLWRAGKYEKYDVTFCVTEKVFKSLLAGQPCRNSDMDSVFSLSYKKKMAAHWPKKSARSSWDAKRI